MTEFEQMQIEQLKRIADVLEDMNGVLIGMSADIESLSDCVGVVKHTYPNGAETKFLRIGGSVYTEG